MPKTVDEGFRNFLSSLTPSSAESAATRNHRSSIEACLKSNFDLKRFFRTGSFGNGTSISGYSDVDYFASIPRSNLKRHSGTSLVEVKEALDNRFSRTNVRVDCPAVKVPFGNLPSETTEVVPADYVGRTESGNYHKYEIADCHGGWMLSSPDAHNAYVREIDQKLNGKVKPLIRFIKAWGFTREVPVSSFYLELRVTEYAKKETWINYAQDVKGIFTYLDRNSLAQLQDPIGISGYIQPCFSDAQKNEAVSKVATALSRAEKALEAQNSANIKKAFEWWDLLYNGHFPSYYR